MARHQDGFTLVNLLHLADRPGGRGGIPGSAKQHGDHDRRNGFETNDHDASSFDAQTYWGDSTTTVTGASAATSSASVVRTLE